MDLEPTTGDNEPLFIEIPEAAVPSILAALDLTISIYRLTENYALEARYTELANRLRLKHYMLITKRRAEIAAAEDNEENQ